MNEELREILFDFPDPIIVFNEHFDYTLYPATPIKGSESQRNLNSPSEASQSSSNTKLEQGGFSNHAFKQLMNIIKDRQLQSEELNMKIWEMPMFEME